MASIHACLKRKVEKQGDWNSIGFVDIFFLNNSLIFLLRSIEFATWIEMNNNNDLAIEIQNSKLILQSLWYIGPNHVPGKEWSKKQFISFFGDFGWKFFS